MPKSETDRRILGFNMPKSETDRRILGFNMLDSETVRRIFGFRLHPKCLDSIRLIPKRLGGFRHTPESETDRRELGFHTPESETDQRKFGSHTLGGSAGLDYTRLMGSEEPVNTAQEKNW